MVNRSTEGAAALATGVLALSGCVLFAAGCERFPTAPDAAETHLRIQVTDRIYRPLAGAEVTILDGALAGITRPTDDAGRFELTGKTAGTVTLRVGRDGFHTRTHTLSYERATSARPIYTPFWLDTVEPPIGLDPGDYTLTFAFDLATASSFSTKATCAGFPVEFASRSYRATIAVVSSPWSASNRSVSSDHPTPLWYPFWLNLAGRFVGFESDEPLLFEEFPELRHLKIGGFSKATEPVIATGSSVSIPFVGDFSYCQTKSLASRDCWHERPEEIVEYHSCSSNHATMVFTKR